MTENARRLLIAQAILFGSVFIVSFWVALYIQSEHPDGTLLYRSTDSWGYYQFLPGIIGTHELDHLPWAHAMPDGRRLDLFTIGVAILQAPFFFLGHLIAWAGGWVTDGYSTPYVICNVLANCFYVALGCALVFRTLIHSFSRVASIAAAVLCYLGTNLYYYASLETGMSHGYAFFTFALLLWITRLCIDRLSGPRIFGLIVACTLVVLVRPLNGIALLIPLLWKTTGIREVLVRLRWPRAFPAWAIAGGLVAGGLLFLQSLYWHHVTDRWLVFTYGEKGEGFEFGRAMLGAVLFSHQNGWLIYTPMMIPVMVALLVMAWRRLPGARTLLLVWALAWWLYASWWCWWLGGSFGFRGMVEHYAYLSIPLAWLIDRARSVEWRMRALRIFLILAVFYNIRMSMFYQWPWEGPSWSWSTLAQTWGRLLSE